MNITKEQCAERVRTGICVKCGKAPAETGKRECQNCLDYNNRHNHERRERYLAAGLCPSCGLYDPAPGRKTCLNCLDRDRVSSLSRMDRRKAAGLCVNCGKPARDGRVKCLKCTMSAAQSTRRLRERRFNAGYCVECGQVRIAGTLYKTCPACREKRRLIDNKRRDKKLGVWKELPE